MQNICYIPLNIIAIDSYLFSFIQFPRVSSHKNNHRYLSKAKLIDTHYRLYDSLDYMCCIGIVSESILTFLDENTSKIIGTNNTYYSIYTSQIEDIIGTSGLNTENNNDGKFILKQGDAISVTVRNSSKTLSQSLKSFYYTPIGSDVQIITATASGTVAINGAR